MCLRAQGSVSRPFFTKVNISDPQTISCQKLGLICGQNIRLLPLFCNSEKYTVYRVGKWDGTNFIILIAMSHHFWKACHTASSCACSWKMSCQDEAGDHLCMHTGTAVTVLILKEQSMTFSFSHGSEFARNSFKLEESRYRLEFRKKFFPASVVKHSNGFPREVMDAPSLKVL